MENLCVSPIISEIVADLSHSMGVDPSLLSSVFTVPRLEKHGDLAISCIRLARLLSQNPDSVTKSLTAALQTSTMVERVETIAGYVNLFLNRSWYSGRILEQTLNGLPQPIGTLGRGKRVLIEFSSPNIAKEFGVGHLRSTLIGNAISNLYTLHGYEVVRVNYLGDWGTQFGKLILGFQRYGDEDQLRETPVKHLSDVYVTLNLQMTEQDEAQARSLSKRLEAGDPQILALWKRFRAASVQEFLSIYGLLGVRFDRLEGESLYAHASVELAERLDRLGLLKTSDGARGVDLSDRGLGFAIVTKQDDTSIYLSRDVAAAIARQRPFAFDLMLYEVGVEQSLHFKQVRSILELLGYSWAGRLHHVEHGLYLGPDGKKLSTRQGTSVSMHEVWESVRSHVEQTYPNRGNDERTLNLVTRAALIFADLKSYRGKDIVFNPSQISSLTGATGPYLLYSYVRANAVLRNSRVLLKGQAEMRPTDDEFVLIKAIGQLPIVAFAALNGNDPSQIANYAHSLSQQFNHFYATNRVLGSDRETWRLVIVKAFQSTLRKCLEVLGIEPVTHM